jgi:hypothetical protein
LSRRVLIWRDGLTRLLRSSGLIRVVAVHLVLETAQGLSDGGACARQFARADENQNDDQEDDQVGWG